MKVKITFDVDEGLNDMEDNELLRTIFWLYGRGVTVTLDKIERSGFNYNLGFNGIKL